MSNFNNKKLIVVHTPNLQLMSKDHSKGKYGARYSKPRQLWNITELSHAKQQNKDIGQSMGKSTFVGLRLSINRQPQNYFNGYFGRFNDGIGNISKPNEGMTIKKLKVKNEHTKPNFRENDTFKKSNAKEL